MIFKSIYTKYMNRYKIVEERAEKSTNEQGQTRNDVFLEMHGCGTGRKP